MLEYTLEDVLESFKSLKGLVGGIDPFLRQKSRCASHVAYVSVARRAALPTLTRIKGGDKNTSTLSEHARPNGFWLFMII